MAGETESYRRCTDWGAAWMAVRPAPLHPAALCLVRDGSLAYVDEAPPQAGWPGGGSRS